MSNIKLAKKLALLSMCLLSGYNTAMFKIGEHNRFKISTEAPAASDQSQFDDDGRSKEMRARLAVVAAKKLQRTADEVKQYAVAAAKAAAKAAADAASEAAKARLAAEEAEAKSKAKKNRSL
jgi:hypothetical protein